MAVITPSRVGALFTGGMRAAPFQGRRPSTADRGETEAQRLAREQQDRQFRLAQKEKTALGITNAVLQLTNIGLQAGLKGWELSRDPADVRSAEAKAERFAGLEEVLREQVAGQELDVQRSGEQRPQPSMEADPLYPASTLGTRWSRTGAPAQGAPVPAQGTPITMSQGDIDVLGSAIANYDKLASRNPNFAQDIATQLTTDEFKLDAGAVESALKQGRFLAKNWESMKGSGALKVVDGPPSGLWGGLAKVSGTGWRGAHGVAESAAADVASVDLMGKLGMLRAKVGDEMLTTVVDKVVQSPEGRRQLQQQAATSGLRADVNWENVDEARRAVIDHLVSGPGEPRGTQRAEEIFGEPTQVGAFGLPEGDLYVDQLKDAYTAFRANNDPRAQMVLDERVIGQAVDFGQVPGIQEAASKDEMVALLRQYIKGGTPEYPRQKAGARALQLYQMAAGERKAGLEERAVKAKETTAKASMARARRLTTNKEFIRARTRINTNTDPAQRLEEWREHQMFHDLVNGTEHVKGYPESQVEEWA